MITHIREKIKVSEKSFMGRRYYSTNSWPVNIRFLKNRKLIILKYLFTAS